MILLSLDLTRGQDGRNAGHQVKLSTSMSTPARFHRPLPSGSVNRATARKVFAVLGVDIRGHDLKDRLHFNWLLVDARKIVDCKRRELHPDRNLDDPKGATEQSQQLNQWWNRLRQLAVKRGVLPLAPGSSRVVSEATRDSPRPQRFKNLVFRVCKCGCRTGFWRDRHSRRTHADDQHHRNAKNAHARQVRRKSQPGPRRCPWTRCHQYFTPKNPKAVYCCNRCKIAARAARYRVRHPDQWRDWWRKREMQRRGESEWRCHHHEGALLRWQKQSRLVGVAALEPQP